MAMAMAGRLALGCSLVLAAATAFSVPPSPTRFAVASTTARAARRHFGRALPRAEAEADVTVGDGRGRERRSVDRAGALDVAFEASDAAFEIDLDLGLSGGGVSGGGGSGGGLGGGDRHLMTREAWLRGALAGGLLLVAMPQASEAGFGPAGGAVISPAPAKSLTLEQLERLTATKLGQVKGSLGLGKINLLLESAEDSEVALEKVMADLRSQLGSVSELGDVKDALQSVKDQLEAELLKQQKQRELAEALKKRQAILNGLEAQPEWFGYVAAFGGSVVSTLVMHPVDTIKTRLISQAKEDAKEKPKFSLESIKNFFGFGEEEDDDGGLLGLYRGVVGNVIKEGPSSALYLGVYESAKNRLLFSGPLVALPFVVYLLAGAVGELFGSIIRAPAEALKASVQSGQDANTFESGKRVFGTEEGRVNVYRAWTASLWRDVPMGAVQIALFEGLKVFIINAPKIDFDVNTLQAEAGLGFICGGIAAVITTPPDVVTTRIITQGDDAENPVGFVGMGQRVYAEGGVPALFTGWKQRALYWAPAIGIFLSCYCYIRTYAVIHGTLGTPPLL